MRVSSLLLPGRVPSAKDSGVLQSLSHGSVSLQSVRLRVLRRGNVPSRSLPFCLPRDDGVPQVRTP